jgi:hypothetical protein
MTCCWPRSLSALSMDPPGGEHASHGGFHPPGSARPWRSRADGPMGAQQRGSRRPVVGEPERLPHRISSVGLFAHPSARGSKHALAPAGAPRPANSLEMRAELERGLSSALNATSCRDEGDEWRRAHPSAGASPDPARGTRSPAREDGDRHRERAKHDSLASSGGHFGRCRQMLARGGQRRDEQRGVVVIGVLVE